MFRPRVHHSMCFVWLRTNGLISLVRWSAGISHWHFWWGALKHICSVDMAYRSSALWMFYVITCILRMKIIHFTYWIFKFLQTITSTVSVDVCLLEFLVVLVVAVCYLGHPKNWLIDWLIGLIEKCMHTLPSIMCKNVILYEVFLYHLKCWKKLYYFVQMLH